MAKYQIQDLGDGQGLDILDDDADGGDLLASGRTRQELIDFLYDHELDDDGNDQRVTVLAGALGRDADEELDVTEVIDELETDGTNG